MHLVALQVAMYNLIPYITCTVLLMKYYHHYYLLYEGWHVVAQAVNTHLDSLLTD